MSPSLVGFRGDGVLVDLLRPSILRLVGGALWRAGGRLGMPLGMPSILQAASPLLSRATNVTRS